MEERTAMDHPSTIVTPSRTSGASASPACAAGGHARVPVDARPGERRGKPASGTRGGKGTMTARGVVCAVLGWVILGWVGPSVMASSDATAPVVAEETPGDRPAAATAESNDKTQAAEESPATAPQEAPAAGTPEAPTAGVSGTWPAKSSSPTTMGLDWRPWVSWERLQSTSQLAVSMTLLGVLPALLLMTTSYVRISVVLALLRQAFGVPNLLPLQVTTALAFFCTGWIMWPTWQLVHEKAVRPVVSGQVAADPAQLWAEGIGPVRQFMVTQIEASRNAEDVHLFLRRTMKPGDAYPASYEEVPLAALLPAFLLSELKTAFIIGFQVYLPFLVIDLVVSAVTTSTGMFLLPPSTIAMPLKLLTFVLVDGWRLVVDMLLKSFQ